VIVIAMVALLGLGKVMGAHAAPGIPAGPNDACQPDPTNPNAQQLHCRYGPLTIGPGQNLIMFGPVTIESPRADGFVTSMKANMVDAVSGQVPPIHVVHLHHGVWLNPAHEGSYTPFFATGEEKTVSQIPTGYGYQVSASDTWVLNYMVHNLSTSSHVVYITWDVGFTPLATGVAQGMKAVDPIWLDVVGGNNAAYPVYNPTRTGARVDPVDATRTIHLRKKDFSVARNYEIVWAGGHVHPGGVRDELRSESCNGQGQNSALLFSSDAIHNTRDGTIPSGSFGSWDYRMTVTPDNWRYTVRAGDRISVTTAYDVTHPFYEAMGIMVAWGHPLAAGEVPDAPLCQLPSSTSGEVTNVLPAPPDFGGHATGLPDPRDVPAAGAPVTAVDIRAFDFSPGGLGQAPAPVAAGSVVTFRTDDAASSINHTVTSCDAPCTGAWGQSYPLATWGFDTSRGDPYNTGQLGFGPPFASAASNQITWDLPIPSDTPVGTTYTYFCRIHPIMRGSLKVVS
jgi:plastocyanin